MPVTIRSLAESDVDAVIDLSLRAWTPVFESFRTAMGEAVYRHRPVGFVAVVHHDETHGEPNSSEIEMIAVDPDAQRRGVADALIAYAVDQARAHGSALAVIGTGGDPGHAPARAAYEKAGFTPFPQVRYYKML